MKAFRYVLGVSLLTAFLLPPEYVLGWSNNGWETDWVLANRSRAGFKIKTFAESPFAEVGSDESGIEYWSGTFAGTGGNDARYFVIGPTGTNDLKIAELGAVADPNQIRPELNATTLRTLAPNLPYANEPSVRNIRYNPVTNSLFMITREREVAGSTTLWEIDLGLNTVVSQTTGPSVMDFDSGSMPGVTIDPVTGTVYAAGPYLNTALDGKGDVVEFDLALGSWSVAIDSTVTGDEYFDVQGICYRNNSIVVGFGNYDVAHQPIEYDLGTGVGMALSGYDYKEPMWNAQMDMVTGSIWSVGNTSTLAANLGAIYELPAGSMTALANPAAGNRYQKFFDIASPAPEPSALALMGIGLLALRRRRTA